MRRIVISGLTGLVATVAGVMVAAPWSAASTGPRHYHFTVVSQESEGTVTPADFFATPPTQNAQAAQDDPAYRNGSKVGDVETLITWTAATNDPILMLECSVELPEGNIFFNGSVHGADVMNGTGAVVPVVGGTGRYAGAEGTVSAVEGRDGASKVMTFDISTN